MEKNEPGSGGTWNQAQNPVFGARVFLRIAGAIFFAAWIAFDATPTPASVIVGPILEGATTTNAYVLAECGTTTPSLTVNYGTTPSYGMSATTAFTVSTGVGSTNVHRVKLTGLQPNTLYHYQLMGQGFTSSDYTFKTLVNPGTGFRFVWQADFRSTPAVRDQISSRIWNTDQPLFALEGGDTCYSGDWAGWHNEFFTTNEQELEKRILIYPSPGNHEHWNQLTQSYYQSPDSSGTNGYYSFDCGDVHVIMANWQTTYASGAQYNWIQQDARASLKPWKIFGTHAPAYSWGGSGAHAGDTGMQAVTSSLLEPNGVKFFLAGHNHFYQHNLVNGIRHMTIGGAGAPLYAVSSNATYTVKSIKDNCYAVFDVTSTNLRMVVYNNLGSELDRLDLVKLPAPSGFTAAAGNGQATLDWNAVSGSTSYSVWYGTIDGGPYSTSTNVTTSPTTITGLTNGANYYFVVTANDANGPSGPSPQASATPQPNSQPPVASFTGMPTSGLEPLVVTFSDTSTGDISNRFWDFGDGGTTNITTNSVVHTYTAGTYPVTVIVSGPEGVSTNTKPGYIAVWTPFAAWQQQYFDCADCSQAAETADPDGDGQNNLAEFLAGTDPTNNSSAFRITDIGIEGENVRVTWTMGSDKTNALQVAAGDMSGNFTDDFTDLFTVTNTIGSLTNYLDSGGVTNAPTRFYRVRLVP